MGKVLSRFTNGFTGAVSRSVDNIVISMGNASGGDIPFGAPVFLQPGENACGVFSAETSSAADFVGFAARAAVKAPDTYGSDEAAYAPGDPVDVLVPAAAGISGSPTARWSRKPAAKAPP